MNSAVSMVESLIKLTHNRQIHFDSVENDSIFIFIFLWKMQGKYLMNFISDVFFSNFSETI